MRTWVDIGHEGWRLRQKLGVRTWLDLKLEGQEAATDSEYMRTWLDKEFVGRRL